MMEIMVIVAENTTQVLKEEACNLYMFLVKLAIKEEEDVDAMGIRDLEHQPEHTKVNV